MYSLNGPTNDNFKTQQMHNISTVGLLKLYFFQQLDFCQYSRRVAVIWSIARYSQTLNQTRGSDQNWPESPQLASFLGEIPMILRKSDEALAVMQGRNRHYLATSVHFVAFYYSVIRFQIFRVNRGTWLVNSRHVTQTQTSVYFGTDHTRPRDLFLK